MTTFLPKSAWRYGIQTVVLFGLAAASSALLIGHIEEQMLISQQDDTMRQISVGVWSLVMGFMFLAGALGLWAIRSTAATEGRRRIARFVDGMNFLSDGLIALNKRGEIIGANPAGKRLFQEADSEKHPFDIYGAFPSLTRQDGESLIASGRPREIDVDSLYPGGLRALRFRSQPSEGIVLLLVSDVTESRLMERRRRQIAHLQLVGRIAGGMANDFSDILCAISGHSALLRRPDMEPAARSDSLDMIAKETRRGALLSRMLLDLSRSGESENVSRRLAENIKEAVSLLRVTLSQEWTIRSVIRGEYPAVPLGSSQVEQVVLNLGLFAADAQHEPGTMIITLSPPGADHLLAVGSQFAAVILISAHCEKDREEFLSDEASAREAVSIPDDSGVILSVVRTMVEESGGRMDCMNSPDGSRIYRVCLPRMDMSDAGSECAASLPGGELSAYVSRWRVIMGESGRSLNALAHGLRERGATVITADNIGALLTALQEGDAPDAMVIIKQVLGSDADSVLQAIVKLAPQVGIVLLCDDPESAPAGLRESVCYVKTGTSLEDIVRAMVDAKALARSRPRASSAPFRKHSDLSS